MRQTEPPQRNDLRRFLADKMQSNPIGDNPRRHSLPSFFSLVAPFRIAASLFWNHVAVGNSHCCAGIMTWGLDRNDKVRTVWLAVGVL